eukprot:6344708-Amphidinium_carterae.1
MIILKVLQKPQQKPINRESLFVVQRKVDTCDIAEYACWAVHLLIVFAATVHRTQVPISDLLGAIFQTWSRARLTTRQL